ncbi:hypothetical protein ACH5RR_019864 [Cinchona calisaya]|uniref:Two-component response regulator-like APRR5 n=1 Tax=Cinchona calisaya TaxID=153742 RepID=A0ABD2ZU59_9GENT
MGEVVVSSEEGNGMEWQTGAALTTKTDASAAANTTTSVVRWESFLPKMVLRVLLVEADDSTRQIIAALLRKCSYRVAAVSDGLKAWEVLKRRPHNIDLILTEVELPSISGFALLTLIMEHEICKNIPVIMMSSQDSVSTVYKCMLRGAVDFLVKPVRKNELRNLWQHVWRRQASSSAGQGPPDESVAQQKVEVTAENNDISNYSSDYMACIQKNRESFEKGSDAQSSCTKPEQDAEGAEMECTQGQLHSQWSKPSNMEIDKLGCHSVNKKVQASDNESDGSQEATGINAEKITQGEDVSSGARWEQYHTTGHGFENNHVMASAREAIDLIGAFDNYLKCSNRSRDSNAGTNKVDLLPQLDLSLRRSLPIGSVNQVTDEKHRLNHSDASAFSRYVNKNAQPQHSTSPSTYNQQKDQKSNSDKQLSNHTVDYNSDTHGPTINSQKHVDLAIGQPGESDSIRFPCPQQRLLPAPIPIRGVRFDNINDSYGSLIPQIYRTQSGLSPMPSPGSVGHQEASFPVNAFYQLNHRPGNPQQLCSMMVQNTSDTADQNENNDEHKVEKLEDWGHLSSSTDQSANSSFCNGTVNHLHSLGCGSNKKIDAVPFRSTAECGNEEAFRVQDGNSIRSVQREAALTKFRLKRKERCFEKKVRYESRKKLAEKRPRVKGQFVRQVLNVSPPENS